jgi:formyltetrahydrofolate hydrolase
MGATLSQCTCLDTWLLSNQSALQEKINTLETNHIVLQTNYASLETDFTVFKKDTTKRLEALEKKSNGMFFVQEESDPDLIVLHKGK